MKYLKLNFRQITSIYINDIPKVKCLVDSPQCLLEFIPTRENQTMCVRCLVFKNILENYPLLDVQKVDCKKVIIQF